MYQSGKLELEAIENVLNMGKLFRYQGKDVETQCSLFEKRLSKYLQTSRSILLSSGTNALVNALFSLGIAEGDEVLVPSYTFFATIAAVLELKAIPIIVNVDESLSFDLNDLEKKISTQAKALIAVHMDGYPCDMATLKKLCKKNNLFLIEDVAQAVGGQYDGKKLGTIGEFGCFSFNMDKIITCGEGGAICTNKEDLYQKAFLYHDTCNQFGATTKDFYTIEKFSGKSMRASEIQGAIINVQLDRLPKILDDLKERKQILDQHLLNLNLKIIPTYDSEGECATTSRVLCDDPAVVNKMILLINALHIKATSPILRPGHNVWQWLSLLPSAPHKFEFMASIDILSRVLLIHVNLDHDLDHWKNNVAQIRI